MEITLVIFGLLVLILAGVLLFVVLKKPNNESALLLKEDLRALSEDITRLKDGVQTQINDRMEKSQATMLGVLQRQSTESNKIITEITKNLTELKESNKRVVDVADELKLLQNILQNPKQRGGLGNTISIQCWVMYYRLTCTKCNMVLKMVKL